ncbi:hypothetical protein [Brumimicrobium aurantiacum]|uniref:Outer membrane protein beta-barrel domain-containing protein n=1 Tax=Brumimicrobium aurantiacum TaxID=1737063 RepID=A0A3E1EWL7_9FLAO|nr:hypothetical protein [Brumimicrobium aurantiacum]RFC53937.1 hypothetical protein DXU93_10340 [Brumimicrobium aurantiacum]
MSIEDKNLDQLFSDAAQSQSAPQYNSDYWKEMNGMLNARDRKKRVLLFWTLGGSAAFAILFLSLFAINSDLMIKERYTLEQTNIKLEKINSIKENTLVTAKAKKHNASLSTINIESNFTKNASHENKNRLTSPITHVKSGGQKNNTNFNTLKRKKATTPHLSKNNNTIKNEANATLIENNKVHSNQKNTSSSIVDKASSTHILNLPYIEVNRLAQNNPTNMSLADINTNNTLRIIYYAKLSGGLMENYKTSKPFESGLFNLSLNSELNLKNVLIRLGVGTQFTGNADLIVSKRATVYGFGVTNHQTDLSYQNLFDIYVPLEFGYKLNKSSFGIGAQINYLLTTSMNFNHYENNFLSETEKFYGYKNGLNTFSSQGYIWYEYQFTNAIALGLKAGTNISGRIEDNAYFNQSMATNPIYGQVTLRYNLFK